MMYKFKSQSGNAARRSLAAACHGPGPWRRRHRTVLGLSSQERMARFSRFKFNLKFRGRPGPGLSTRELLYPSPLWRRMEDGAASAA